MNWVLTAVLCAVLVELISHLPFLEPLKALFWITSRAMHVVAAKTVSDHRKAKAMNAYAQRTLVASAKIAAFLATVGGVATVLILALNQLFNGFQEFVFSRTGLSACIITASLYIVGRRAIIRG